MNKEKKYILIFFVIFLIIFSLFILFLKERSKNDFKKEIGEGRILRNYFEKDDYKGIKGEEVFFEGENILLDLSLFEENIAYFYNVKILDKRVYFFIVKDRNGIYRAAANECQVCYQAKRGFRQEGDEMVCNNCGNRYPIEKIGTEKGGCNPIPISPNLQVVDKKIIIEGEKLNELLNFF